MSEYTQAGEWCIHKTEICNCSKCLWAKLIKTESQLKAVDELAKAVKSQTRIMYLPFLLKILAAYEKARKL
jgi:hypothetical protein